MRLLGVFVLWVIKLGSGLGGLGVFVGCGDLWVLGIGGKWRRGFWNGQFFGRVLPTLFLCVRFATL